MATAAVAKHRFRKGACAAYLAADYAYGRLIADGTPAEIRDRSCAV